MLFHYLFVFMVGSVYGYFLELLYRRIMLGKWIKPGVFYGIYLPLYGMGLCICYFVYCLNVYLIVKIILVTIFLTFIELLCGLIFIKYFKLKLWNYERNSFNYKGLICLKFSVCWGILGLILIRFVFPYLDFNEFVVREVILFMYLFYVVFISDVLYNLFYLFYIKYFNKYN